MSIGDFLKSAVLWQRNAAEVINQSALDNAGTTSNVVDAYSATVSIPMDRIHDGENFAVIFNASNTTTTPTLSINGLTGKTITRFDGTALTVGEILVGKYLVSYNQSSDKFLLFAGMTGDLNAIEALSGTSGILCKTAANAWALRTLTAPAAGISVSNGTGSGGNPTLALVNDLSALEGLGSTGIAARTAADTWAQRTIQGTTDTISITNGDGVSGNPTIDIAAKKQAGWIPGGSWSYASATTITIASGGASKYSIGDKLELVQTTTKYFVVVGVADTLLTITGGTDYTLVNAAISSNYYSHESNPVGFPHHFNYSPTPTGFSVQPTFTAKFNVTGRRCTVMFATTVNGTSNTTGFTVPLPITAAAGPDMMQGGNTGNDNGVYQTNVLAQVLTGGTVINLYPAGGSALWTAAGGKGANFNVSYDF